MAALKSYDVVIVGAGPAGAYLAGGLAADGVRVAIVDRSDFPRDKVCGGGLSQKTLSLLPQSVKDACATEVSGAIISFGNRRHLQKSMDGSTGAVVLRSEFDFSLLEWARSKGAHFHPRSAFSAADKAGAFWRCRAGAHELSARVLVGADGVFSRVRHQLFGPRLVQYTAAVEAYFYGLAPIIDRLQGKLLFDFAGTPHGYGWIFPKADHLNVGVYSIVPSRTIRDSFARFCATYPFLAGSSRVKHVGHAIPVRNRQRLYERDHCLLVGDAGGFAEALYGEGIYFALKSADCARRAISRELRAAGSGNYSELIRRELEPDLSYSLRNARLFFRHPALAYRLLAENGLTADWFSEVIHGGMSHREVFWRTIATAPYWALFGCRTRKLDDSSWLTAGRAATHLRAQPWVDTTAS